MGANNKEEIKNIVKGMFSNGEIVVDTSVRKGTFGGKKLVTAVYVDNLEVAREEQLL